uniref:Putative trypsin inhibitor like cysteine rich domain protein n=1 Tax=Rhipicephalus microplus TaxID=6941 RepID=A0A6G5A6A2_RHIMP
MTRLVALNFSFLIVFALTSSVIEISNVNAAIGGHDPAAATPNSGAVPGTGGAPSTAVAISNSTPPRGGTQPGTTLASNVRHVCGRNEKYETCRRSKKSYCDERTCKTRFNLRRSCTSVCRRRCICRSGFYRNHKGRCVRFFKCGSWIDSVKEKLQTMFKGRAE